MALRERSAASRPRGRPGRAVGHLRALSPAQGQRRPDGQRNRRARHAGDGVGRPRRRHPSRARGPQQRADPRRLRPTRHVVRLLHADDDPQPLRRRPGHVPHPVREGVPHRADDARRDRPRDRPYAPRPLHRGDLPDLRLRRGARRPVRQLRQPARSGRPDRPALDRRRLDARVPRDDAPVPRPPRVPRAARRVDRDADALAAERPQLRAQPRAGGEAARHDPRHRLGRSRSGRGLPRGHQAHLRLVRRGDRLPLSRDRVGAQRRPAGGVARVVAEPGRAQLLLHGQGQHRLPRRHLALDADGLRRRPAAPVQRRLERVPDDERQQGEHEPRSRDLGQGLPRPLRGRRAALLPHRRGARDAGQRLHLGGIRPPHERRAARQLGQPRQPDARERPAKLRRGPRARPAHARATVRFSTRSSAPSTRSASTSRTPASGPPWRRTWRRARSRTSTSPTRLPGRS